MGEVASQEYEGYQQPKGFGGRVVDYLKSVEKMTWIKLGVLALIGIAIVLVLIFAPWQDALQWFLDAVDRMGIWAPIIFIEVYIACTLLFIPGSLLTIGAGIVFQSVWKGFLVVSAGSTIGATGAFLWGNTLVRKSIEQKLEGNKIFAAIDRAIATQGWYLVFLLRLSPVLPFNLLNYGLGLTQVGLIPYILASWIGMMPGTVVYVYLGYVVGDLVTFEQDGIPKSPWRTVLLVVGLIATFAVLVIVTIIAKRAVQKALADNEDDLEALNPDEPLPPTESDAWQGSDRYAVNSGETEF